MEGRDCGIFALYFLSKKSLQKTQLRFPRNKCIEIELNHWVGTGKNLEKKASIQLCMEKRKTKHKGIQLPVLQVKKLSLRSDFAETHSWGTLSQKF